MDDIRQSKLEDAIAKLTEISSDLNKMVAVHELRLTNQEKITDSIEIILEKRRDEFERRMKDVYETIKEEDKSILEEIQKSRQESSDNQKKLSDKINDIEKRLGIYTGIISFIAFIIAYGPKLLEYFQKVS